jgi:putative hydrolase of the HAD superfamily
MQSVRRNARELWHASPTYPYCREIGISSWEGLWGRFCGDLPELNALGRWVPEYRLEAWRRGLAEHGIRDESWVQRLAEEFGRERRQRHQLFLEVPAALQELRSSFRLALITNGAPDLQREKVTGAGLDPFFEIIVASGDIGIGKPDPRVFRHTLERLGLPPSDAVMVGDNLLRDVGGAQRVGMRGIWINRHGTDPGDTIIPDATFARLSDLLAYLRS